MVNRKVFGSYSLLNVSGLRRYNKDFVRNIKKSAYRQFMRDTTNSRQVVASVMQDKQVDRVDWLSLLTVCEKHLPEP